MRTPLTAALFILLVLAMPGAALAGDVSVAFDTAVVSEPTANEKNDIELNTGPGNELHFTAIEKGAGLTMSAGDGCVSKSSTTAECNVLFSDGIAALHGGDDTFHNNTAVPFAILGKAGADKLFGGSGIDTMAGGVGNDESHGGEGNDLLRDDGGQGDPASGNDKLFGDGGDDLMLAGARTQADDAGAGSDTLDGGPGTDTADYSQRTIPQTISEDGLANDGQGAGLLAEHDNVAGAEIIVGGSAGDRITGGAPANTLRGAGGNDDLDGGAGPDRVLGEEGNDVLVGGLDADLLSGGHGHDTASYAERIQPVTATLDGGANDGVASENDLVDDDVENLAGGFVGDDLTGSAGPNRIRGNDGDDTLGGAGGDDSVEGGDGDDTIRGDTGNDVMTGDDGDDSIAALDVSMDLVVCGKGVDTVAADPFDNVGADCERVSRGTGALSLPKAIRVTPKRTASVRVGCPAKAYGGCARGVLTLFAKGKKVATASFSAGAGDAARVQLRLSSKALATLRAGKPRSLKATSKGAGAATEAVTVKLPPA